jgi:hypothetical protein
MIFVMALILGLFAVTSNAHALSPETEMLLQLLEKKGVVTQDEADALRKEVEAAAPAADKETMKAEIKEEITEELKAEGGILSGIQEHITLSGLIEVEASFGDDFEDNDLSDIVLATVELGIDAEINDWVQGHLLLLYEEDDTEPIDVDEGTITIGNPEVCPGYVTAGKMYVPFGNFETHMISDPLTLELGETNESAVQVGIETSGFYASVYAFNGDVDEHDNHDDEIEGFGANVGFAYENDNVSMDLGVDYINSIGDSDLLTEFLPGEIDDYVEGCGLHGIFNIGPFTLIGEYIEAVDEFEVGELAFGSDGAEPSAWNVEAGYTFELAGKETTLAIGYQGTDEALALELPEYRLMGSVAMEIFDGTSLAFEWAHDEDYDESDGGTGEDADIATVQLGVEF